MGSPLRDGNWEAALCFDAQTATYNMRRALKREGIGFERRRDNKLYQKYIGGMVPIPRFTYMFIFELDLPDMPRIMFYDTRPTHSGTLHFIRAENITEKNFEPLQDITRAFARSLPRKPWKFYWRERFRYALFAPEYLRAKGRWKKMGVE